MQTVLIVIHLMIVLALVGVVLLQRSEGGGLGIGGGSGFMSARGAANALTRTTAILAAAFFVTSLALGILARYQESPTDILERIPAGTDAAPGILDQLGGPTEPAEEPASEAPAVPTDGAQVPTGDGQAAGETQAPTEAESPFVPQGVGEDPAPAANENDAGAPASDAAADAPAAEISEPAVQDADAAPSQTEPRSDTTTAPEQPQVPTGD